MIHRRQFLASAGMAFVGMQRYARAAAAAPAADSRLIEPLGSLVRDPAGILDLPEGFRYRVLARLGEAMDDGLRVPGMPDGMAAFPGPDGKVVLVCNHELALPMTTIAAWPDGTRLPAQIDPADCHDPGRDRREPHLGGTSNIVFDPDSGEKLRHFLSLTGTDRNCAGGAMPWGSWITCEESEDLLSERGRRHGWCFEVKATDQPGLQPPRPLKALGRFRHEAVALDPASGILYLTEDRTDGLLYRFIPREKGKLAEGRLQALRVVDRPSADLRNYVPSSKWPHEGEPIEVDWIDLDDVEAPLDDLRLRGHRAGAAVFARGEGIHFTDRGIFLCCTDGGPARRGQILRLQPSGDPAGGDRLELFLQSREDDLLTNGDNLCVAPWGDLVICEDLIDPGFARHTHVRAITPEGRIHTLARNSADATEFAGSCFSPDGRWLFVNLQGRGLTLAITGPWPRAA